MRNTVGMSALLRNQSLPEATCRTSDHPVGVRSANLSDAALSVCSIQLRSTPAFDTDNSGAMLRAAAGTARGSTLSDHCGGADVAAGAESGAGELLQAHATQTAASAAITRSRKTIMHGSLY